MVQRLALLGGLLVASFTGVILYVWVSETRTLKTRPPSARTSSRPSVANSVSESAPALSQPRDWPPVVGKPFPDKPFIDTDGKPVSLRDFRGKVILLHAAAMSCPGSIALAGGHRVGAFGNCKPQAGAMAIERYIEAGTPGITLDDPRIARIDAVMFNAETKAPSVDDLRKWKEHFTRKRSNPLIVLGATAELAGPYSMAMVPGIYILDRDGMVRYSVVGSNVTQDGVMTAFRAVPRLCDPPPEKSPEPTPDQIAEVGKRFQARPELVLPSGNQIHLQKDQAREREEYLNRTLVQLFRADGPGSTKWKADAVQCVSRVAKNWYAPSQDHDAVSAGYRALEAGCDDAIFLTCYARALLNDHRPKDGERVARLAVAASERGKYPPIVPFRAKLRLAFAIDYQKPIIAGPRAEVHSLVSDLARLFAAQAALLASNPLDSECLFQEIDGHLESRGILGSHIWEFANTIHAAPDVDGWLKDVMMARAHQTEAWRERGSGYASDITKEGSSGMARHAKAAGYYYLRAWKARPKSPIAATEMLDVYRLGGEVANESPTFWMGEAAAACFDHEPAYTSTLWSLRPRWFGSHAQMLRFGEQCLDTKRFDTIVPTMFAKAVADVSSELRSPQSVYRDPAVYEGLSRLYAGLLASDAWTGEQKRVFHCEWALVAYLADHMDVARAQTELVQRRIDDRIFKRYHVSRSSFEQALGITNL